jgi:hypothetical protein
MKLIKAADGAKPGYCKLGCGALFGHPHNEGCQLKGRRVNMDEVVQLGGEPGMLLEEGEPMQSRLALFLYRILRDTSPGTIERATVEAEVASANDAIEVTNSFLYTYAENVTHRLLTDAQPVTQAREVVEGLLALLGPEGVQPTDAERSVLAMKAENWLEKWGPEPIPIDAVEEPATSDAGQTE